MAIPHAEPVAPGTVVTDAPPTAPAGGQVPAKPRSLLRRGWEVFAENKLALAGLGFVIFILLFCFVGPHIFVTEKSSVQLQNAYCHPGGSHLLGCTDLGYDVLGRLMVAGQNSLIVGLAAAAVACTFGAIYGAASGFAGGVVDTVMMRIVDAVLSIPYILVIITLVVLIHPTTFTLMAFIALIYWPQPARLVRGETLTLRTREYVQAVKVAGGGRSRAMFRHIMPNAIGVIIVQGTFAVADAILILAGIGFLGFGIAPPATDWGSMLSNGLNYITSGYWWLIYPAGLLIIMTCVSFNFIGDALRDAFETRLHRR
jgi:peptide/nickel transport system permease protein